MKLPKNISHVFLATAVAGASLSYVFEGAGLAPGARRVSAEILEFEELKKLEADVNTSVYTLFAADVALHEIEDKKLDPAYLAAGKTVAQHVANAARDADTFSAHELALVVASGNFEMQHRILRHAEMLNLQGTAISAFAKSAPAGVDEHVRAHVMPRFEEFERAYLTQKLKTGDKNPPQTSPRIGF
jgi:hypothetical protein